MTGPFLSLCIILKKVIHREKAMELMRLEKQLDFLREIDRLKTVVRQSPLLDQSRKENSAEHSWHLAM